MESKKPNGQEIEHKHFATTALHGNKPIECDESGAGAAVSEKEFFGVYPKSWDDSCPQDPYRDQFEARMAQLEYCKYALTVPSGVSVVANVLKLLQKGDHIISPNQAYGTLYLHQNVAPQYGIDVTILDNMRDSHSLRAAMKETTKQIWFESPTNPLMDVVDIEEICKIAKEHNCLTIFDSTIMTPYLCNPAKLGVDIVWHSVGKYIGGHSDLMMGVLCTNNEEIYLKLKSYRDIEGSWPPSLESFLALKGLETLKIRMKQLVENTLIIAEWLQKHPNVKEVRYPGLANSEGKSISLKQCRGEGGSAVLIVYLATEDVEVTRRFVNSFTVFTYAPSLGAVESLAMVPALSHQRNVPKADRVRMGYTDNLIRLSIGLEDVDDLIGDLERAFEVFNQLPTASSQ